jgi:putative membrane protein
MHVPILGSRRCRIGGLTSFEKWEKTLKEFLMKRFLIHWLVIALALWVTAYILPGVHIESNQALAIAAIVLGLVNALVRPILTILTLPITILTLGLFYLLVNGFTFLLASKIVPGFGVSSYWWAVLGALIVSIVSSFVGSFFDEKK